MNSEEPKTTVDLALEGNVFSRLAILQHAQIHLMRPSGSGLAVSLDGDFTAILKLQSAEGDLLNDAMSDEFAKGTESMIRAPEAEA